MAADGLDLCISRPSAAMVLPMLDNQVLIFNAEEFQQPVPSQCKKIMKKLCLIFSSKLFSTQRLTHIPLVPGSRWPRFCRQYRVKFCRIFIKQTWWMLCLTNSSIIKNQSVWRKSYKGIKWSIFLKNFQYSLLWFTDLICSVFHHFLPVNSSPCGQNGHHFADNIFWHIFWNEKVISWIKISLKFVHKGPIDKSPSLIQIMAWRRIGDRPLSEPMLTRFIDTYMWH